MNDKPGKLDRNGSMVIPAMMIPGFRSQVAIDAGVERSLLFRTFGGIGDQVCVEPTLRYALKMFKGCEISLATELPELFRHLPFKRVFDLHHERPEYEKFLTFDTITPPDNSNLVWQFFGHMITNCVDFPSLCALRCQLPIADREVKLVPIPPKARRELEGSDCSNDVWVHPGRHWQSKTFPKAWWNAVLAAIVAGGGCPVLIGADADDNRGTVDVDTAGCLDLRNELSINDTIYYLQNRAKVLLTNDSAPLHMAVSGGAWIGYVATVKHPDYISHWRRGQWAWRMENLGKGGVWDVMDYCPNKAQTVEVENVGEDLLRSWLPDPNVFAGWALDKLEI